MSGNSIGLGRKGYIRSGSKGNITMDGEGMGDEIRLKEMISPIAAGSSEKVGRERGNKVTITVERRDEGSVRSHNGSDRTWDLEQGHSQSHTRQSSRTRTDGHTRQTSRTRSFTGPDPIGEWPVTIRKTVQTHVTS